VPNPLSVTVYDPSPSDPRILAALTARKLLGELMRAVDIAGVESLTASDILVNAPINKVVDLKNIIGRLKANQISYESAAEEVIDFVGVRGDMVVIMGEEINSVLTRTRPMQGKPYIVDPRTCGSRSMASGSCGFVRRR